MKSMRSINEALDSGVQYADIVGLARSEADGIASTWVSAVSFEALESHLEMQDPRDVAPLYADPIFVWLVVRELHGMIQEVAKRGESVTDIEWHQGDDGTTTGWWYEYDGVLDIVESGVLTEGSDMSDVIAAIKRKVGR